MKKGSLEIGISFTVVMIVALILLGLALAFALNVFSFANEEFPKDVPNTIFHANKQETILPETRVVAVKAGEDEGLLISVYNNLWDPDSDVTVSFAECRDSENLQETGIRLVASPQKIQTQEDRGYLTIVQVEEDTLEGSYVCTIIAGLASQGNEVDQSFDYNSNQIQIEVK